MKPSARLLALLGAAVLTSAHVGSPDTFFEGPAGPYPIRVIVRSPGVVPGQAEILVRLLAPVAVRRVLVLPVYWDPRTAAPPPPDVAARVPGDTTLFRAALWLMRFGSYGVQVTVEGPAGPGVALVPVQAVATRRLELGRALGLLLAALGCLLFAGAVTAVGAAVRESGLDPGAVPDRARVRAARLAMAGSAVLFLALLAGGRAWWLHVDRLYQSGLYRPRPIDARALTDGAPAVRLTLGAEPAGPSRSTPLVPDHGHLIHLFLMSDSTLAAFAHLHPVRLDSVTFEARLPPLPPGRYRVYGDIVHESGFAETLTGTVALGAPVRAWSPSDPDDAWAQAAPDTSSTAALGDGATMRWLRGSEPLRVGALAPLRFVVRGPEGRAAALEPYMGMAGHLMLARQDGAVFAHLHPAGTISMASQMSFELRAPGDTTGGAQARCVAAMAMPQLARVDSVLSFPYAFPQPGRYRLWIETKRRGRIVTGTFDAVVAP